MAAEGAKLFAQITSWLGFICGCLTLVVWCFLLPAVSPRINVSSRDFIKDVNKETWRLAVFSFAPEVFIDFWTPFVMGVISILCHLDRFKLDWICKSFLQFFLWNFILALFGNIGYSGGIGIIVASFTLLTTLLSLLCVFVCDKDQSASLHLSTASFRK